MNNKTKKRLGVLLLIFGFILSAITFAYWTSGVVNPGVDTETGIILIGQGKEVSTTIDLSKVLADDKVLVPTGRIAQSEAVAGKTLVESVVFTLKVKWESDVTNAAQGTNGTLNVTLEDKNIGGSANAEINGHVNVSFAGAGLTIVADGDEVEITVTVTLTEPATKALYDSIYNQNINLEFKAVVTQ